MREPPRLITAAELDKMTPDQRAAVFAERTVTNLDDVPEAFRQTIISTAERLSAELDSHDTR